MGSAQESASVLATELELVLALDLDSDLGQVLEPALVLDLAAEQESGLASAWGLGEEGEEPP